MGYVLPGTPDNRKCIPFEYRTGRGEYLKSIKKQWKQQNFH